MLLHQCNGIEIQCWYNLQLDKLATSSPVSPGSDEKLILGIESSCDDTGVAVVSTSGRVLGESCASQVEVHAPWGGVVPKLAMEAHERAIDRVVEEALQRAQITASQLDAVAVTIGPGLSLCLKVRAVRHRTAAVV